MLVMREMMKVAWVGVIALNLGLWGCGGGGGTEGDLTGPGNTEPITTLPTVKTLEVRNILYSSVKVTGQLFSSGGAEVTERGVCWSTQANPTTADNCVVHSGEEIKFTDEIKGLSSDSPYNARAYAVNKNGTAYGENLSFRTLAEGTLPVSVDPLLESEWQVFSWPYNAFYPEFDGDPNVNGRFGAPCGATAFARVLAYWKDKIRPTGTIDAMNTWGAVRFEVDLDTLVIDYTNLPATLSSDATYEQYKDVAKLFLVAGAIGLTNEMDAAGSTAKDVFIEGLKRHLNVSGNVRFADRWEYSKEDWVALLKDELAHGRPLMVAGRTADSPAPWEDGPVAGHWYNVDGYNEAGQFRVVYNMGGPGVPGYLDADQFGEYGSYNEVIVGFEPGG